MILQSLAVRGGVRSIITTDNLNLSVVIKNVNIGPYAFKLPSVNMPIIEHATENIYISFYILLYKFSSSAAEKWRNKVIF